MKKSFRPRLYIALIHHPVVNKNGDVICSAVTNLDLHDISRAAKTYGVRGFYVVTPLGDQQTLVRRILEHWLDGAGGDYNPIRRDALELIRLNDTLEDVLDDIREREEETPKTVATRARGGDNCTGFAEMRKMLESGRPHVLLFGTAWGLSEDFVMSADCLLDPVKGASDYNHLSVRSAVSIILDRLVGNQE